MNRIVRIREATRDLFGRIVPRWRVIRTSNAYSFIDPLASKNTADQGFFFSVGNSHGILDLQNFPILPPEPKPQNLTPIAPSTVP